MVSLKVLLVLILIVAVTCEPCRSKRKGGCKLRHRDRHHKRSRTGADVAVKGGLKGSCKFLFSRLKRHCKFRKNVDSELINLRLPTDIDSTLSFLLRLGLGCGSAIDLFIPGFGDLVSRLIGLAIRIIACYRGALGRRGFCDEGDYYEFFGITFGQVSSIDVLFKKFGCQNVRSEIEEFINIDSEGQGINYYTGSKKIIIKVVFDILKIVEKKESKKEILKKDFTYLADRIIALIGAIGNDYSKDFGNSFTENAVDSMETYISQAGCPSLKSRKNDIIVDIKDSNTQSEDEDLTFGDLDDDDTASDSGDDTAVTVTVTTQLGGHLQKFLTPILRGKGRCRASRDVMNEMIGFKNPKSFVEVANFCSNLSIVIASIVDTLIYGLGNLIGRIMLCISRITLCVKNKGNDGYCSKNFVKVYGIDGSADTIGDLIELYKVKDAKKQVLELINKHTKGKGVKYVKKGAQKTVLASCVTIAELLDNFDDSSYSNCYIQRTIILAAIGNSFEKKLGDTITSEMSSACDKYVQQKGYTAIQDQEEEIKKTTMSSNNDSMFKITITETTTTTIEIIQESSSSEERTYEVQE